MTQEVTGDTGGVAFRALKSRAQMRKTSRAITIFVVLEVDGHGSQPRRSQQ